ncbi:MAG: hypothetical protein ACTSQE_11870 [Candidatus Heimdallarchaeaceae archaeon]
MELQEIIEEIRVFLKGRGWEDFPPSDVYIHLIEELGEIGKHILFSTGYKTESMGHKKPPASELEREFAQTFSLFIQLVLCFNIDLEEAWKKEFQIMKNRFSPTTKKKTIK